MLNKFIVAKEDRFTSLGVMMEGVRHFSNKKDRVVSWCYVMSIEE